MCVKNQKYLKAIFLLASVLFKLSIKRKKSFKIKKELRDLQRGRQDFLKREEKSFFNNRQDNQSVLLG